MEWDCCWGDIACKAREQGLGNRIMEHRMMRFLILACLLTAVILQAQQPQTKTEFDFARQSIKQANSYQPPNGYLPDQKTATAIAYAVAVSVYGKSKLMVRSRCVLN